MEVDMDKVLMLAESAERRAGEHLNKAEARKLEGECGCEPKLPFTCPYHSYLNDFFYWSGKATSYRGIIAMAEMRTIVEDELEAEGSCP